MRHPPRTKLSAVLQCAVSKCLPPAVSHHGFPLVIHDASLRQMICCDCNIQISWICARLALRYVIPLIHNDFGGAAPRGNPRGRNRCGGADCRTRCRIGPSRAPGAGPPEPSADAEGEVFSSRWFVWHRRDAGVPRRHPTVDGIRRYGERPRYALDLLIDQGVAVLTRLCNPGDGIGHKVRQACGPRPLAARAMPVSSRIATEVGCPIRPARCQTGPHDLTSATPPAGVCCKLPI